jgi:hypothetical protein
MTQDIIKNSIVLSFRDLRYWAQDGMVSIMDEKNGELKQEAPMTMRYRAVALAKEAESMKERGGHYADERKELLVAARDLMTVVKAAEDQGCPLDPRVMQQQIEERKRVYVSLSGLNIPTR